MSQYEFNPFTGTFDIVSEGVPGSGLTVSWGDIDGTLSNQTDLQGELDDKLDKLAELDSPIKLLYHFNGDNGSKIIVDETGLTIPTLSYNAHISTDESKFGGSSFETSLEYQGDTKIYSILYARNAEHSCNIFKNLIDSATISFWFKYKDQQSLEDGSDLFCYGITSNEQYYVRHTWSGGSTGFFIYGQSVSTGNNFFTGYTGTKINDLNWHHIAIVKVANLLALYLDGQQLSYFELQSDDTLDFIQENAPEHFYAQLIIGENMWGSNPANAYYDEFMVTHNNYFSASPVVGLTDSFSVPTAEETSAVALAPVVGNVVADGTVDRSTKSMVQLETELDSKANLTTPSGNNPYVVQALLHAEGTAGVIPNATSVVNSSGFASSYRAYGAVEYSDVQKKFGNTSFLFQAHTDLLLGDQYTYDDIQGNDFTFEMWIYPTATITGSRVLVDKGFSYSDRKCFLIQLESNRLVFKYSSNRTNVFSFNSDTEDFDINAWTHVAVVRDGDTLRFFKNGVPFGTGDLTGAVITDAPSGLAIASYYPYYSSGTNFVGYIDEIRISINTALFTEDFSQQLPTEAYPGLDIALIDGDGDITNVGLSALELERTINIRHSRNQDTKLAEGTDDEVSASELRETANGYVPRLTTIERDNLTPSNGLIIYNTTLNKFQGYENGAWANLI